MYKDNNKLAMAWKKAELQEKRKIEGLLILINDKFIDACKYKNPVVMKERLEKEYKNELSMSVTKALETYIPEAGNFFSHWCWVMRGAQYRFDYAQSKEYEYEYIKSKAGNQYRKYIYSDKKVGSIDKKLYENGDSILDRVESKDRCEYEHGFNTLISKAEDLSNEEKKILEYKFIYQIPRKDIAYILNRSGRHILARYKSGIRKLKKAYGVIKGNKYKKECWGEVALRY